MAIMTKLRKQTIFSSILYIGSIQPTPRHHLVTPFPNLPISNKTYPPKQTPKPNIPNPADQPGPPSALRTHTHPIPALKTRPPGHPLYLLPRNIKALNLGRSRTPQNRNTGIDTHGAHEDRGLHVRKLSCIPVLLPGSQLRGRERG